MADTRPKTRSGATVDRCTGCGGGIANRPIHAPSDDNRWVHIYDHDWEKNPHEAVPEGGPVADACRSCGKELTPEHFHEENYPFRGEDGY